MLINHLATTTLPFYQIGGAYRIIRIHNMCIKHLTQNRFNFAFSCCETVHFMKHLEYILLDSVQERHPPEVRKDGNSQVLQLSLQRHLTT